LGVLRGASTGKPGEWARLAAVAGAYAVSAFWYWRTVPEGLTSPWFVIVAMICVLGLAFVASPVIPLRVPGALRAVRDWEARGRVYRALGVPAFGTLLRRTPLRLLNTQVYLRGCGRDRAALTALLESAEASHFWAGLLVLPYVVYASIHGAWATVFWIGVAQALVNAYPIAHLRLARSRVERIVRKASAQPER
jgi:hypothetical protein